VDRIRIIKTNKILFLKECVATSLSKAKNIFFLEKDLDPDKTQGKLFKIPDPDPVVEKLQKISGGLESLTQSPNSERSDLRFKA
jgi:hypothetical protein